MVFLCSPTFAEVKMSELVSLSKQNAWSEIFRKLSDIPANERGQVWTDLLERSASEMLVSAKDLKAAMQLIATYSELKESKNFGNAFRNRLPQYFQDCVEKYWEADECAKQSERALEATHLGGSESIVPLWRKAFSTCSAYDAFRVLRFDFDENRRDSSQALCHDFAIQNTLVAMLKLESSDPLSQAAIQIFEGFCTQELRESIKKAYSDSDSKYLLANTCEQMLKSLQLSSLQTRRCQEVLKEN